jgi:hypothetical protein
MYFGVENLGKWFIFWIIDFLGAEFVGVLKMREKMPGGVWIFAVFQVAQGLF